MSPISLYKRIKIRREELGITQDELAGMLGYKSRSTIAKIEAGANDLTQTKIEEFAKALKTSAAYLLGWDSPVQEIEYYPQGESFSPPAQKIPLLGKIACGKPKFSEENFEGYVNPLGHVHADFAVTADGDSMVGAYIRPGDIVFIRQQPIVENGEIAAVAIDDEVTLKRFRRLGDTVILSPENPNYDDIIVNLHEDSNVTILGKAVAFQSLVK